MAMTFSEYRNQIPSLFKGYLLAQLTDEYYVGNWPGDYLYISEREGKLLDIRVFNQTAEYRLFRSGLGKPFRFRAKDDGNSDLTETFDEEQFLDIDTKRSGNSFTADGSVYTTGGGVYHLPLNSINRDPKVRIRYYLDRYEKTGQAKIVDWRIVDFVEES